MDKNMENLITTLEKKLNIKDKKDLFFIVSKCTLISKLRTQKDNGDDILKKVYPYIMENENNVNYDSVECLNLIDAITKQNDTDIIGYIYEKSIPEKTRKDLGQFYTRSNNVIDYMVDLCELDSTLKILEPSSGSGLFLINIINRILSKTTEQELETTLINIFKNIKANDCDELAAKIIEINILISVIDYIIIVLKKNQNFVLPKLNITNYNFCYYAEKNTNDLVISNPPYVTMYGRRSRNMNEEKRAYFNTFDFVLNKKGNNKFNMVMFFIEKGLKSLKEHGKLIYIIDISFFETAFIDLRKYILDNCYIETITTNLSEFEDVASGQVILSLVKDTDKTINKKTKWYDYKDKTVFEIDQNIWNNNENNYKIFLPLKDNDKNICDKIEKHKKLDYYFPNKALRTCCALTGRTEDFLVSKDKKTTNIIFPFLEGSKGIWGKFCKPTTSRFIEYDYDLQIKISDEFKEELTKLGVKNKKRVTLGDKEAYLSPKIFIRQSANEIIATYTDEPYSANNSIYILTNKKNDVHEIELLKYTCGILNSDLITYYSKIKNIIRSGNGKTPQIKTSDLKNIRIAFCNEYYDEVIRIVENLLDKNEDEQLHKLNDTIYKIYNINENEIKYINEYLKKDD